MQLRAYTNAVKYSVGIPNQPVSIVIAGALELSKLNELTSMDPSNQIQRMLGTRKHL